MSKISTLQKWKYNCSLTNDLFYITQNNGDKVLAGLRFLFCFVGGCFFFFFLRGLTAVSYNELPKFIHAYSQPMESSKLLSFS